MRLLLPLLLLLPGAGQLSHAHDEYPTAEGQKNASQNKVLAGTAALVIVDQILRL